MVDHRAQLASLAKEFRQIAVANTESRFRCEVTAMSAEERNALSTQLEATRRRLTRELRETLSQGTAATKDLEFDIEKVDAQLRAVKPD